MKSDYPLFGILSGCCTTMGLAPYLLILALLLLTEMQPSMIALVIFTIAAKLLGEYFFWTKSVTKISNLKNPQTLTNQKLLSHPNVIISLLMVSADALAEGMLFLTALKMSLSPILILFALLACQALAAPIQGAASDFFSQKKSLLFAAIITMLAILASKNVSLGAHMILILCIKGLLGNIAVIARSSIAEVIKHETTDVTNP